MMKRRPQIASRVLSRVTLLWSHHRLLVSSGLVVLLIGLGVWQYHELQQRRQAALKTFFEEQAKKRTTFEQEVAQQREAEARRLADEHKAATKQIEEVAGLDIKLPECKRLQNREAIIITSASCDYNIRAKGQSTMAVVFISEAPITSASDVYRSLTGPATSQSSLQYINTYLKREAARHKVAAPSVKLTFYGPYAPTESVASLYYRDNIGKYLQVFDKTTKHHKVPEANYDMVHYVYLGGSDGGAASPNLHRAFTISGYGTVPVFIHETLHLFGANDKYHNNDCNTVGRGDPFASTGNFQTLIDIMCQNYSLDINIINTITAREIGWSK